MRILYLLLIFINLKFVSAKFAVFSDLVKSEFPFHASLDDEDLFQLHWKFDNETITFRYDVVSKGWAGLGFSPNGGMAGSDIVIMAFDQTGKPFISDRHADHNGYPMEDKHQDYDLIRADKNDTHIQFTFSRKRKTCDNEDWELTEDTTRIIFAKNDAVPENKNQLLKHTFRSSKSVHLFDKVVVPESGPPPENGVISMDLTMQKLKVPDDQRTVYWCDIIKLSKPAFDADIIKMDPIIQAENINIVHHILAYFCPVDMSEYVGRGGMLCMDQSSGPYLQCLMYAMGGWAKGGQSMELQGDVGMPLSNFTGNDLFMLLEIHYDNPQYEKDIVDSSGLRLWLTPHPRPIKAGVAIFGIPVGSQINVTQIIPPGVQEFTNYGYCSAQCTSKFPKEGIKILGGVLHTHLAGRKMRLQHFRGGKQLPPIFDDEHYDFNYQDYREKREHVVVLPGDELVAECVYGTLHRNSTTFSGLSTKDEMCLIYAVYYPNIYLGFNCISTFSSFPEVLTALNVTDGNSNEFHWTPDNVQLFQNATRDLPHAAICISQKTIEEIENGSGIDYFMQNGYPNVTEPWLTQNHCTFQNGTT